MTHEEFEEFMKFRDNEISIDEIDEKFFFTYCPEEETAKVSYKENPQ